MANKLKTYKINILSEAVSPITHMSGTSGNESIINREKVFYNNSIVDVPVLSGNALRHKLIREPGALYTVDQCDLSGKLNIDQANFMFTGGSLSESSANDNIPLIARLQTISPLFRLLGGSLKNQIIGGSLFVSRGILACEENRETLKKLCDGDYQIEDQKMVSAHSFISKYQYTRNDAANLKDASHIIDKIEPDRKTNLMIYAGESIIPGALFYHDLVLYNVSELELGAALHSLKMWQDTGGIIGGSSRIGHGKLKSSIWIDGASDDEASGAVLKYIEHVRDNKEEFGKWLQEVFK